MLHHCSFCCGAGRGPPSITVGFDLRMTAGPIPLHPIALTFCLTSLIGYARLHVEFRRITSAGAAGINQQSRNVLPDQRDAHWLCRAIAKTIGCKAGGTGSADSNVCRKEGVTAFGK